MHPFHMGLQPAYDTCKFIYHYTKLETARDCILPNRTLRLSQLADINDSKESISNDWQLFGNENQEFADTRDLVIECFRLNVKAVCFSRDDQDVDPAHQFPLDPCSRGYVKPRMWTTYGRAHKGVCLVFDRQRLEAAFRAHIDPAEKLLCGPVSYGRPLSFGVLRSFALEFSDFAQDFSATIHSKIDQNSAYYFFFKHLDWITENEYRFVLISDRQQYEDLPFDDALAGVALSMETSSEGTGDIVSIADKAKIPVVQPIWGLNHSKFKFLNEFARAVMDG